MNSITMSNLKLTLVLASVICASSLVQTLDLGVVTENQIKILSNGTANTTVDFPSNNLMFDATYDPIKKDIYLCNQLQEKIFRIKTTGKSAYNVTERIVARRNWIIRGIAFDYLNSIMYWVTLNKIFYVHVPDIKITAPLTGQVLLRFDDVEKPQDLAIDVRRKYLYWVNYKPNFDPITFKPNATNTIERVNLDGSGRQVLMEDAIDLTDITVDEETNTLYWINSYKNNSRSLQSMDLWDNGTRHTLIHAMEIWTPKIIALDDRNLYWIESVSKELYMIPKNSSRHVVSPTLVSKIKLESHPILLFVLSGSDAE